MNKFYQVLECWPSKVSPVQEKQLYTQSPTELQCLRLLHLMLRSLQQFKQLASWNLTSRSLQKGILKYKKDSHTQICHILTCQGTEVVRRTGQNTISHVLDTKQNHDCATRVVPMSVEYVHSKDFSQRYANCKELSQRW